jgi:hypothetical protein
MAVLDGYLCEQQDCVRSERPQLNTLVNLTPGAQHTLVQVGLLRRFCVHHHQPDSARRYDGQHDGDSRIHYVWRLVDR